MGNTTVGDWVGSSVKGVIMASGEKQETTVEEGHRDETEPNWEQCGLFKQMPVMQAAIPERSCQSHVLLGSLYGYIKWNQHKHSTHRRRGR